MDDAHDRRRTTIKNWSLFIIPGNLVSGYLTICYITFKITKYLNPSSFLAEKNTVSTGFAQGLV